MMITPPPPLPRATQQREEIMRWGNKANRVWYICTNVAQSIDDIHLYEIFAIETRFTFPCKTYFYYTVKTNVWPGRCTMSLTHHKSYARLQCSRPYALSDWCDIIQATDRHVSAKYHLLRIRTNISASKSTFCDCYGQRASSIFAHRHRLSSVVDFKLVDYFHKSFASNWFNDSTS